MQNTPQDTQPESWQRFFASAANNRAWQLADDYADPANAIAVLNAAHASAFHWRALGTELNHMRATMLLAHANALVGHGLPALALTEEVRSYFFAQVDTPAWELAFVHAIHAHAASVAGDAPLHAPSYVAATRALEAITDAADRDMVLKTYRQVPAP